MKVNNGSKIKNLMGFAMTKMKDDAVRQMAWNGSGQAVTKVLSCAEIMKRKVKNLHQITGLYERKEEEYWEPKTEGLERLRVVKNYPAVTVLLSKDHLDTSHPSYQPPGVTDGFWKKSGKRQDKRKASGRTRSANTDVLVPLEKKQKGNKPHNKQGKGQEGKNKPQNKQGKGNSGPNKQGKQDKNKDQGKGQSPPKAQQEQDKGETQTEHEKGNDMDTSEGK